MTIAYLITAYDFPEQLARLVNRIKTSKTRVFIHIDANKDVTPFINAVQGEQGVEFIQNRIKVNWMGFSQVQSILELLRRATAFPFENCILLSGSDYPIKSNAYIESIYSRDNHQYITFWQLADRPSWKHKVEYFYPIDQIPIIGHSKNCEPSFFIRYFWGRFYKYQKYFPKRSFIEGLTPFGGSDWWSLSRDCVEYVLDYVNRNRNIVSFYKFTQCPSEMFFHTIILNSPFRTQVQNYREYMQWNASTTVEAKFSERYMMAEDSFNLRYIDWSSSNSGERETPAILDERDWPALASTSNIFARKFHPEKSASLLARIDRELLTTDMGNAPVVS